MKHIATKLLFVLLFLFPVVIIGEFIYLGVINNQKKDVIQNTNKGNVTDATVNTGEAILTDEILDSISSYIQTRKPILASGVLRKFVVSETYESTIMQNGRQKSEKNIAGGGKVEYVYTIAFSDGQGKETGFVLSEHEMEKVAVFKLTGETRTPIRLEDIKTGDRVRIIKSSDLLKHPRNNLISLEIVKQP